MFARLTPSGFGSRGYRHGFFGIGLWAWRWRRLGRGAGHGGGYAAAGVAFLLRR